jgi:hypothetical protein
MFVRWRAVRVGTPVSRTTRDEPVNVTAVETVVLEKEATVSRSRASAATGSDNWDYQWQQVFAVSGVVGVALCLVAWEVFWPQPPDFSMSGAQTAQFYAVHQAGMLIGITLSAVGMPFLIAWTIQLGAMLRRLEGGSGLVAIVATVGTVSIPILLAFDCAVWSVAAYRPETSNPDVTRAFSDLGWISSMLIWPPLAAGMALTGVVIFKSRRQVGAFPLWAGWLSYLVAFAELGQAGIIFYKSGPFAPNGAGSWYLAVFTWGPWIVLLSVQMSRMLAQQHRLGAPDRRDLLMPS